MLISDILFGHLFWVCLYVSKMKTSYMKTTNMFNPTDIFTTSIETNIPTYPLTATCLWAVVHSQDEIPKLVVMETLHSKAGNLQISNVLVFVFRIEKQGGPITF